MLPLTVCKGNRFAYIANQNVRFFQPNMLRSIKGITKRNVRQFSFDMSQIAYLHRKLRTSIGNLITIESFIHKPL